MADTQQDFRLEIAHVLFIDIVGFSKSLINEQSEMLRQLNRIVRDTAQVKAAEATEKLIRLPEAKAAAQKALAIDDSLAEAHASLSFSLIWFDWDWANGEKEAKRAIALNPNSSFAHLAYGHVLSDLGRHKEAIAEVARAKVLDPVFLLARALAGMFFHHARRDAEASASLQSALELDPNFWITHLT